MLDEQSAVGQAKYTGRSCLFGKASASLSRPLELGVEYKFIRYITQQAYDTENIKSMTATTEGFFFLVFLYGRNL